MVKTTEYNFIVVAVPKEGLAGMVPAKLSFGWASASQAFFWYGNDKDLKATRGGPHTCLDMVTVTMNYYRNGSS